MKGMATAISSPLPRSATRTLKNVGNFKRKRMSVRKKVSIVKVGVKSLIMSRMIEKPRRDVNCFGQWDGTGLDWTDVSERVRRVLHFNRNDSKDLVVSVYACVDDSRTKRGRLYEAALLDNVRPNDNDWRQVSFHAEGKPGPLTAPRASSFCGS
jgi:hypothetical protein